MFPMVQRPAPAEKAEGESIGEREVFKSLSGVVPATLSVRVFVICFATFATSRITNMG
jgi:hypothetical protein